MTVSAHQLYAAKRADQRQGTIGHAAEPKWLKAMPQIYSLTAPLSILLHQLPLVQSTHNESATKVYWQKLVAEITKVYAYRVRLVELSDRIPEKDKAAAIDRLIAKCNDYLATLANLLEYGSSDRA